MDASWEKIFTDLKLHSYDFDKEYYILSAEQIKRSCQNFTQTNEKEVRILCKHDTRESRPEVFKKYGLFLLPVKNGRYAIVKGEGYIDIPSIKTKPIEYTSKLDFDPDTSKVGDSEMQHLDLAYATSILRTFMDDNSLILTIRGRKYTPHFKYRVGEFELEAESVQTEVDGGYEGKTRVVLVEAKPGKCTNVIIRQLYFPFRQWQEHTKKKVETLFFEMDHFYNTINLWHFKFDDFMDYNSISLVKSDKFYYV